MFKQLWVKAQQRWHPYMAGLFLLLAFIANVLNPGYGIPLSMSGLMTVVSVAVLSGLVGGLIMLVDKPSNNMRAWMTLSVTAFIVLVVAALVTPLSDWIMAWLPL